jgi:hypothetical protein
MTTVRAALLVLVFLAPVWPAKAAPAPIPKPTRRDARKDLIAHLRHRLRTLGATPGQLVWDERTERWVFVFLLPREDRGTRLRVTTSTDRDGLEALRTAVFISEQGAGAPELP